MCIINKYLFKIKKALNFKDINNKLFKVYLDYDMVFYSISFDEINTRFVYDEVEFYDSIIEGVPAYLKLQKPNKKGYEYFPKLDYSRLESSEEYAIVSYKYNGVFSTNAVTTIQNLKFVSIRILKNRTKNEYY
jgi:hypothetical protein